MQGKGCAGTGIGLWDTSDFGRREVTRQQPHSGSLAVTGSVLSATPVSSKKRGWQRTENHSIKQYDD